MRRNQEAQCSIDFYDDQGARLGYSYDDCTDEDDYPMRGFRDARVGRMFTDSVGKHWGSCVVTVDGPHFQATLIVKRAGEVTAMMPLEVRWVQRSYGGQYYQLSRPRRLR